MQKIMLHIWTSLNFCLPISVNQENTSTQIHTCAKQQTPKTYQEEIVDISNNKNLVEEYAPKKVPGFIQNHLEHTDNPTFEIYEIVGIPLKFYNERMARFDYGKYAYDDHMAFGKIVYKMNDFNYYCQISKDCSKYFKHAELYKLNKISFHEDNYKLHMRDIGDTLKDVKRIDGYRSSNSKTITFCKYLFVEPSTNIIYRLKTKIPPHGTVEWRIISKSPDTIPVIIKHTSFILNSFTKPEGKKIFANQLATDVFFNFKHQ